MKCLSVVRSTLQPDYLAPGAGGPILVQSDISAYGGMHRRGLPSTATTPKTLLQAVHC